MRWARRPERATTLAATCAPRPAQASTPRSTPGRRAATTTPAGSSPGQYRRANGRSLTSSDNGERLIVVGNLRPGDRSTRLAEMRAELVRTVREHRGGLGEPVLDDRIHRIQRS